MKQITGQMIFGVFMLWLVCVAASFAIGDGTQRMETIQTIPQATEPEGDTKLRHTVHLLLEGKDHVIELEDYLVGVLLSEMPSSFHQQAKRAQAVAARTFTVHMAQQNYRHGSCAVCDDPGCCQGYLSPEDFLLAGGGVDAVEQAREAVQETAGMVLTYQNALIEATYFSCSGGRTEDAVSVWGTEVPYLQAVDSPGEEGAEYYMATVRFTAEEFQNKLGISLKGNPTHWFGSVSYTDGGGVDAIQIGGKTYSGTQLRSLLDLRSSSFTVTPLSHAVLITTRGFGHRVGLSQYGADAMAKSGSSWQEILAHYYLGTEIKSYN